MGRDEIVATIMDALKAKHKELHDEFEGESEFLIAGKAITQGVGVIFRITLTEEQP